MKSISVIFHRKRKTKTVIKDIQIVVFIFWQNLKVDDFLLFLLKNLFRK